MLRSLCLRHKLLAINLVSVQVTVLFVCGYWLLSYHTLQKEHFYQRIHSQGSLVAQNISGALNYGDLPTQQAIIGSLQDDRAILTARVSDRYHEVTASFNLGASRQGVHGLDRIQVPIVEEGEHIGSLEIIFSLEELAATVRHAAIVAAICLLLAALLGVGVTRRAIAVVEEPIEHLAQTARSVTQTKNYSLRSRVYYPDEVGELSAAFNTMLGIIENRDKTLQAAVDKRTAQLRENNDQLLLQIQEREKTENALNDVEAVFHEAFINAPIGMGLLDANGRFVKSNMVLGALIERTSRWEDAFDRYLNHQDQKHFLDNFNRLVAGHTNRFEQDVEFQEPDGKVISIVLYVSLVKNERGGFRHVVLQCQDVTDHRRMSAELTRQARHDELTGLPNRRVLKKALTTLREKGCSKLHTLCILDVDQFKMVNDTSGHGAGDELLKTVARVVGDSTRRGDLTTRLGGDEFAVLLYHCDSTRAAVVLEKLRRAVEAISFHWEGCYFHVSVSIGAMACELGQVDANLILQQVDAACFAAKDQGRNRVNLVEKNDATIEQRKDEMQWVHRLHRALENDHFLIYVQPIKELEQTISRDNVEVLIRLKNETDGRIILPNEFIPAAERYGLMTNIDRWVITTMIQNLPKYSRHRRRQQAYWINLSGASVSDKDFLEFLQVSIRKANLPPGTINFEITETSVINNLYTARDAILRLKALGCRFSLDDFGSGMSSFGYLKQLPVDLIKIDGMFIRDLLVDSANEVFVKSIIDIAGALGMKTVAEYIESPEILFKVKELGVSYAQGYALGRPEAILSDKLRHIAG